MSIPASSLFLAPAGKQPETGMRDKARLEAALRTLRTLMRRHGGDVYMPLADRLLDELEALKKRERRLNAFLGGDLAA